MANAPVSELGLPSSRTLEWLAGTDLLKMPTGTSPDQLAALGPIASVVETVTVGEDQTSGGLPAALAGPANQAVLDTHAQLEETGHDVPVLNGPLHGLTGLGETIGLGYINTPGNLVTDVVNTALSPNGAAAPILLADATEVVAAIGLVADTGTGVADPGAGLVGNGGVLSPVTSVLNQGVLGFHETLEDVGHQNPTLNGPVHGLIGLGETVGLGHIGAPGNVLTDVTELPGALLAGGGVGALTPVVNNLGDVTTSLDTLVDQVVAAPNASGGLLSPAGLLAPASGLANAIVLDAHDGIEGVGHDVPVLNDALHAVTNLGETVGLGHLGETGNLVTDVATLPGALLSGGGAGAAAPVLTEVGETIGATQTLVGSAVNTITQGLGSPATDGDGPLAPVTSLGGNLTGGVAGTVGETLGSLPEGLESGGTGPEPVADLLGGAAGGTLGGLVPGGDAGSHPLVSVGAGPETASPIASLDVLSGSSGPGQTVQVDAVDVGGNVPALASLNLLAGDSIAFPAAGGGGADALVGGALDLMPSTSHAPVEAAPPMQIDLGVAALDLGGHADSHAADAGPHAQTPGLHLLGL